MKTNNQTRAASSSKRYDGGCFCSSFRVWLARRPRAPSDIERTVPRQRHSQTGTRELHEKLSEQNWEGLDLSGIRFYCLHKTKHPTAQLQSISILELLNHSHGLEIKNSCYLQLSRSCAIKPWYGAAAEEEDVTETSRYAEVTVCRICWMVIINN